MRRREGSAPCSRCRRRIRRHASDGRSACPASCGPGAIARSLARSRPVQAVQRYMTSDDDLESNIQFLVKRPRQHTFMKRARGAKNKQVLFYKAGAKKSNKILEHA